MTNGVVFYEAIGRCSRVLGWTNRHRAGALLKNLCTLSLPAAHAETMPASAAIFNSLAILVREKEIEELIGDKKESPMSIREAV